MCHPGIDLVGRYVPDVALVGSHITALPLTTTVKLSPELEPELVLVGSYVPTLEMVGDTLYEDD
jgi:hypothetical protein